MATIAETAESVKRRDISASPRLIFSDLLNPAKRQEAAESMTSDIILEQIADYIGEATGKQIPEVLIERLKFRELEWKMLPLAGDGALMFFGFTGDSTHPDEALATLRLRFGRAQDDSQPRMHALALAGVMTDNHQVSRVVALEYNLTDLELSPLTRLNVSMAKGDLPQPEDKEQIDKLQSWYQNTEFIPTTARFPEYTAALITPRMVGQTRHHEWAASLFSPNSEGEDFNFLKPEDAKEAGFVLTIKDSVYQLTGANWRINVPTRLEKA